MSGNSTQKSDTTITVPLETAKELATDAMTGVMRILIQIVVLVALAFVITLIALSNYVSMFSFPLLLGLGLVFSVGCKVLVMGNDPKIPMWYGLVMLGLLLVSAFLFMSSNVDTAWWGAVILLLTLLVDVVAVVAYKWYLKGTAGNVLVYGTLIGDVIAIIALAYLLYKSP